MQNIFSLKGGITSPTAQEDIGNVDLSSYWYENGRFYPLDKTFRPFQFGPFVLAVSTGSDYDSPEERDLLPSIFSAQEYEIVISSFKVLAASTSNTIPLGQDVGMRIIRKPENELIVPQIKNAFPFITLNDIESYVNPPTRMTEILHQPLIFPFPQQLRFQLYNRSGAVANFYILFKGFYFRK